MDSHLKPVLNDDEAIEWVRKLADFRQDLNTRERVAVDRLIFAARNRLIGGEVVGYDAGYDPVKFLVSWLTGRAGVDIDLTTTPIDWPNSVSPAVLYAFDEADPTN